MHETYRLSFRELDQETSEAKTTAKPDENASLLKMVVLEKPDDTVVSTASLRIFSEPEPCAELEFDLVLEFRDLSYSSEVCLGLLQLAFTKFGVLRVSGKCPTGQELMRRTFTRVGMALREFSPKECRYDVRAAEFLVQEICLT